MPKISLPPLTDAALTATHEAATQLAEALGETEHAPRAMLFRLVRVLGGDQALALLEETRQIEAAGGMLTLDQRRRRTIGGVYFHLARTRLKGHPALGYVFPFAHRPHAKTAADAQSPPALSAAPPVPLRWEERESVYAVVFAAPGGSHTMKVTLIGRPGAVVERGECIVTALPTMKIPALPKGVPVPEGMPQTPVAVYIAKKQWRRVAEAIQNPEDVLIVEGFGIYDPQISGMAILAQSVTTKALEQAKRQPKPAAPSE